jgi:hypothetical protein
MMAARLDDMEPGRTGIGMDKTIAVSPSTGQGQALTSKSLSFETWHARLKGFNAIPDASRAEPMTRPITGHFESRPKAA